MYNIIKQYKYIKGPIKEYKEIMNINISSEIKAA